jgi:uncharacterized protein YjbI with pentapeptide repeats
MEYKEDDVLVNDILEQHQLWLKNEEEGKGAVFMNIDFTGFDFSAFNLSKAIFKNCNFTKAIFSGKEMNGTKFIRSNFLKASFSIANIFGVKFKECSFSRATFSGVNFNLSLFQECSLEGTIFYKTIFDRTHIKKTNSQKANLREGKFIECEITECNFTLSDFSYSNFNNCILDGVLFEGCDMHSSKTKSSNFTSVKFKGLEIDEETKIKTSLQNSIFEDCNFIKCVFQETKDFLAKIIIKNSKDKNITKLKQYLPLVQMIAIATSIISVVVAFNNLLGPITSLLLCIILSCVSLAKILFLKKIKYLSTHFILRATYFASFTLLLMGAFYINWFFSLKYFSFNLSISILLLFMMSSFYYLQYLSNAMGQKIKG